ncbi:unnamed protein product [Paramecium primaurelia]|uniref:ABC transporter family protein n=1 Tax=Paramecium primaurelia TaxID=5886 RepID=A0A8S1L7K9_PARPR|nr:unnamed protein product [Paramecium primaurelia]
MSSIHPTNTGLLDKNVTQMKKQIWYQQLLFTWVYPLLFIGKNQPLRQQDLYRINQNDSSIVSFKRFHYYFSRYFISFNGLQKSLFLSFIGQLCVCLVFYFISVSLFLCQPFITEQSQKFFIYETDDEKPSIQKMLIFSFLFFIYMFAISLLKPFQLFQQSLLSIKIQGALQQQILIKTLKFPVIRSQHYSSGELINLLQVDIMQASNYYQSCFQLFLSPIFLIATVAIFYMTLGKQALVPVIGTIIQTLFGILFGYYYGVIQKRYMNCKDLRMKSVDEALIFSKQLKLNCLEEYFEERIKHNRDQELKYLKYQVYLQILILFMQCALSVATYEFWFLFADELNFGIVTIMMQNYQNIAMLLSELPNQLRNFQTSRNSINRLSNYFQQNEIPINTIAYNNANENSIEFINSEFDWQNNDKFVDNCKEDQNQDENVDVFGVNINLSIGKGKFIAFVGGSASGKSTILRSILGETNNLGGQINLNGSISVAMQEPWIISGSIRQNITFLNAYDSLKYKKVIQICGLDRDLKSFKNGDETILGEKGDNLSGGQQKRINLARAVYNDADIYLLDDPLSSLDIKVKYQIHQQCFNGYLKNKTRILFTNSISNLQECDMIYILENGRIVKQGTFAQIKYDISQSQSDEQKEYIDIKFEESYYPKEVEQKQELRASLIVEEDQQQGSISKLVFKQIYKYLGKCWLFIIILGYFVTTVAGQMFGNSKLAMDGVSDDEFRSIALVAYLIIQFPTCTVVVLLKLYYLYRGLKTSKQLHEKVINSLVNASYTKFYNTILIGRLMNRLSKDIYNIDLLFPNEVYNLTSWLTTLLLPLIACYLYLNVIALPILIVFFIFIIYLTIIYYRCLREVTRIESVSKSPVFSLFQQIVRGSSYVRTSVPYEKIIKQQQENVDIDLGNQICLNGFQYWYQSLAGTLTNIFQTILFIICFLYPGKTQKMTNMVLSQMQVVSQLLLNATVSYGNIQMYGISFERCLHLANNIELEERNTSFITPSDENENQKNENFINAIEFDKCSFQYRPNSKCILSNLSFSIKLNEKIGIVGRTGAGKSSIILALTQILDQTYGSINILGKNMNSYKISELRKQFSIIPQDPLVFMGSLRNNLDPENKYVDSTILKVCEICQLFDLESFKQQQLLSEIQVQGSNLSQGEKQLLNIARCLLDNQKIILVDEATASIDGPTEEKIKDIFEQHLSQCTILTIAHKVTTIMKSDRIMVLDDGNIIEFDTPLNLLQNENSEFKQIIELIKHSEKL